MNRKDTFCANFCQQVPCSGDPDAQPCAVCGWNLDEHVTYQQLEEAAARREARLIVNRVRFRLYIYQGFRYACVYSRLHVWRFAAGNSASDLLGIKSYWLIKSRTAETEARRRRAAVAKPMPIYGNTPPSEKAAA